MTKVMKNIRKIYVAGLVMASLSMTSCTDMLLNPVPESVATNTNSFNKASDLEMAVLGTYQRLQSRVPTDYVLMETPSDNAFAEYFATAPGLDEINTLDVSQLNNQINLFWQNTYNGVFRANQVLASIDTPTDYVAGKKDQLVGEAKFMRAYFYFDLVRIYGGVPRVTEVIGISNSTQIARASEAEIYELIISDLTEAIEKLPKTSVQGRANKGAGIALLAKVQVYRENWTAARTLLERLNSEFTYELLPNYADLFETATEVNKEAIFSMPYVEGTNGHNLSSLLLPNGGIKGYVSTGSRVIRPSWDLHRAFEEGDSRFASTIEEYALLWNATSDNDAFWYPYFNKWRVKLNSPNASGLDIPLLRYADMVLLYAEVLHKQGDNEQALVQLNKVRERAFKSSSKNYQLSDFSSSEAIMNAILDERRLELACENNRWFDLVRTGKFVEKLQSIDGEYNPSTGQSVKVIREAKPYMKYFPIPYEQIQLSGGGVLVQNEGY
jgi:hypothetical protein